MRKTIARRLAESKFTAPHFYLKLSVDMGAAVEARKAINAQEGVKVSFNDMVVKAVSLALKKHPAVNSAWMDNFIRQNDHVHIGVAVAVEDGLLVPVVRHADRKSLTEIGAEVSDYAGKAREKKLQPSDWEGNTFTISNLGMFGIEDFTAIINPPDACILAVGGISDVPVVKDGAVVPGKVMKLTLSCDHRVVDGATGAAFLQEVKSLLEHPVRMLARSSGHDAGIAQRFYPDRVPQGNRSQTGGSFGGGHGHPYVRRPAVPFAVPLRGPDPLPPGLGSRGRSSAGSASRYNPQNQGGPAEAGTQARS